MVRMNTVTQCFSALMAGLLLWLVPVVAVQAGDDYLSLLEAEAADTGAGNESAASSDNADTPDKKAKNMKADKLIEPGLSYEGFEEILSSRYSGSNFLYVKLSEKERKGIYRFYQSDNRISSVREEIVRRLSSS